MQTKNISISAAILITGGSNIVSRSAEVFLPWSNTTCHLPSLPDGRVDHVQAGPLICGGGLSRTNRRCLRWGLEGGGWETLPLRFSEERYSSSVWDRGDQLVIMGGYSDAARKSSDSVSIDGTVSRGSFAMKYKTG